MKTISTTPFARISASDIEVPDSVPSAASLETLRPANPPELTAAETIHLFRDLRAAETRCGPSASAHDKAIVLIAICIERGLDTRPRIVGALRRIGYDHGHIALTLKQQASPHPDAGWWQRRPDGRYALHPARGSDETIPG